MNGPIGWLACPQDRAVLVLVNAVDDGQTQINHGRTLYGQNGRRLIGLDPGQTFNREGVPIAESAANAD